MSLKTAPPPEIGNSVARDIQSTSVRMEATANAGGLSTDGYVEYSRNADLTSSQRSSNMYFSSGTSPYTTSVHIFGLQAGTLYYYRIVASNIMGEVRSSIGSFRTLAPVAISPAVLDFGSLLTGVKEKTLTLTVTNRTPYLVSLVLPAMSAPFRYQSNCAQLTGLASCTISVSFDPRRFGSHDWTWQPTHSSEVYSGVMPVKVRAAAVNLALVRSRRPSRAAIMTGAEFQIEVAAATSVDADLELTCDGLPVGYRCIFAQNPLRLTGGSGILRGQVVHASGRLRQASTSRTTRLGGPMVELSVGFSVDSAKQTIRIPVRLP